MTLPSEQKILLIVDDNEQVLKTLARNMGNRFAKVLLASTPTEAEKHLKEEKIDVLICDCNLGIDIPKGCELIPKWRREYPSIQRAVLFTGEDITLIKAPPEIDVIIVKACETSLLYDALEC